MTICNWLVLALKKGIFMRHWMMQSTIAPTWKLHRDNLALCPISTDPPPAVTTIEHTGGVNNNLQLAGAGVEEGNFHETLDDAVSKTATQEESDNPPAIVDAAMLMTRNHRILLNKTMTTVYQRKIITPTGSMINQMLRMGIQCLRERRQRIGTGLCH
jgi:hypothetical protein